LGNKGVDLAPGRKQWYHAIMKYEVDLPDDIDRRLSKKASATGDDVVHLIQTAVVQFVSEDVSQAASGTWSEEGETRRRALIDKDIAGTITADELIDLARLDRLANEHFDRISPPPIGGAERLHDQLFKRANGR
jgi:predicted transcriptional regulator